MMRIPNAGDRIRLLAMPDDPDPIPPGSLGTVVFASEVEPGDWQVLVQWDNGRTLNLAIPPDLWEPAP